MEEEDRNTKTLTRKNNRERMIKKQGAKRNEKENIIECKTNENEQTRNN